MRGRKGSTMERQEVRVYCAQGVTQGGDIYRERAATNAEEGERAEYRQGLAGVALGGEERTRRQNFVAGGLGGGGGTQQEERQQERERGKERQHW